MALSTLNTDVSMLEQRNKINAAIELLNNLTNGGGGIDVASALTGAVPVKNGGTGITTISAGQALIGNGVNAITTRAITNMTTRSPITPNTNLITANALAYWDGSYDTNGNSNIVRVGTVNKGTWQATNVGIAYGGTGRSTRENAFRNIVAPGGSLTGHIQGASSNTTLAVLRNAEIRVSSTSGTLQSTNKLVFVRK